MNIQSFDFSVNILQVIIWQYAQATNLVNLLNQKQNWWNVNQTQFWLDWYANVFNLQTANTFGLSVWSYILGVPLYIVLDPEPSDTPVFGFNDNSMYPTLENTYLNFGATGGNFSSRGSYISLSVEETRFLLRLRYFQLYTRGNCEYSGVQAPNAPIQGINNFLEYLINSSSIGYTGTIYVLDNLNMTITYVFTGSNFPSGLLTALTKLDILPRPAGVAVII